MSQPNPVEEEPAFVWIEDKVYGFLKIQRTAASDKKEKKRELLAAPKKIATGDYVCTKDGVQGLAKQVDDDQKKVDIEIPKQPVMVGLPLAEVKAEKTVKVVVQTEYSTIEKQINLGLNTHCHSLTQLIREEIGVPDVAFITLFSQNKIIHFRNEPEPLAKVDVVVVKKEEPAQPEAEKVESPEVQAEPPAEKEKGEAGPEEPAPEKTEQPASDQPQETEKPEEVSKPAETEIAEKPAEPEAPKPEESITSDKATNTDPPILEVLKPEGEQDPAPEKPTEEQTVDPPAEGSPADPAPAKEEPPKEEAAPAKEEPAPAPVMSEFTFKDPLENSEEHITLDRKLKIGQYDPALYTELEVYVENTTGYRYAQCFDHILVTEETPNADFSTLISITSSMILRGIGIIGPAPSAIGKPILDFSLEVFNISSGLYSYVKVKREGPSEKCHFYYLEPPMVCRALDQVQVKVDSTSNVAKRGRYLPVTKEDPSFFGLEGTRFSIDNERNRMIAGISYTLEEIHQAIDN